MTNLFKDWPCKNIGVITDVIHKTNPKSNYLYYRLGREEIKFPFPFYLFQSYYKSGPYTFEAVNELNNSIEIKQNRFLKLKKKIQPYFDYVLNRIGLFSFFYSIKLSESLKKWILDFRPDIIYVQAFENRTMQFGNLLYEELKIPYAIHIMDDSVNYINKSVLLRDHFQRLIEKDFETLIINAQVHLCISEAMAEEYFSRYGKVFLPFRNPIVIDQWQSYQKNNKLVSPEILKIIYTGRIFPLTFNSFIDICRVVDRLNRKNITVSLEYTLDNNPSFLKRIRRFKGISFHPPVDAKELPKLIQQYDIFLICINFDKEAQKYLQFSMSTRASEGMISGVPVLVYAPVNLALFRYFEKTESGCMVGERDLGKLEMAILKLWHDSAYRERISTNAVKTALTDSNSNIVREEFRKALTIL